MEKSDESQYENWLKHNDEKWETLCTRCGACCGLFEGDPCEHLRYVHPNKYACAIYSQRFGTHKTLSGKPFRCVPIRNILNESWNGDQCCGYKKNGFLK